MNPQEQYVVDVMTPNPVVVGPEATSWSAASTADRRGVHYLLVIDGYRLVGVVCCCDFPCAGATMPIGDYMRKHPTTIDDQQTAGAAKARMTAHRIGCLPVVDWSGALRGVITRHDLRGAGLLSESETKRCASCGSTHGLQCVETWPEASDSVRFCIRCREQGRKPQTSIDEGYVMLGGGD
jgi:signal-transduction protein with cAMP-binding, CBS, and nucleotidyltransferase domain